MSIPATQSRSISIPDYVADTKFGFWFLGTKTWSEQVLKVALKDLIPRIQHRQKSYSVVVDVGCGQGLSFSLLHRFFRPTSLIGVEYDAHSLAVAATRAKKLGLEIELLQNDCAAIALPDATADIIFCHQVCHHLVRQEESLAEFYRILKPGGLLLFAESTKAYIHSWLIRWLFEHPMDKQRTAEEYVEMLRKAGFQVDETQISTPYLWWSRADLGLMEWLFRCKPKPAGQREETLINVVAIKSNG
ncbi:class I SAM-dependent methyltransferase [Parvibium lacunae]|uniref:Class I SAM-dependent methyltransferase n=1 Tax=Parvibium lacunae TaxID=1888893 RepID=A0A368L7F6_9BURK|nr:class I SAM-dependent methyltransferase [Parvibium lacunae]RCS59600.1 class I SAM-dependent methyltransferase [Parvibium lacunae]